jgi:DNA-binding NarL/FixJ family response regulator
MSGHDKESLVKEFLMDDQAGFIQKPFTIEQLLTAVRALLDHPAAFPQPVLPGREG